jgi:hypothetical protein
MMGFSISRIISRAWGHVALSVLIGIGLVSLIAPSCAFAATSVPFTINMSEAVTVTGTPRIAVDVGGVTRYATYTSGSGSAALVFTYAMVAGDVDLDGVALSSPIDLNGGTITDLNGNPQTDLTFTVPNTSGVKIDYPSLSMDFIYDADGRYTLNGTAYNDLTSFLGASGGTFSRASIGTYFDSSGTLQTASSGTPRFDHDPVTHAPKGILIEEARTNVLLNSGADTGWVAGGTTPPTVANSLVIDGIPCASVTFTNTMASGYLGARAGRTGLGGAGYASALNGQQYTPSIWIRLSRALIGGESFVVYYTGGYGLPGKTVNSSSTSFFGTWARMTLASFTMPGSTVEYPVVYLNSVASDLTVYMARGQFEAGSFPTSYIPTTTAAVTRAADNLTVPTTGGWFTTSSGSFSGQFQEASAQNTGGTSRVMGSSLLGRFVYRVSGDNTYKIYDGTNIVSTASMPINSNVKISSSYGSNGLAISANGAAPVTGSFDGTWGDQGFIWVGANYTGYISKYNFYPSQLSNTQLQLMTQ